MRDAIKIDTDAGRVLGALDGATGVRSWKGMPYAAAPLGPLRWRPPQPLPRWSGTRPALAFGDDFPQAPLPASRAPAMSEDGLFVNVWSPANAEPGSLPVMVWLHGGGFVGGSGADARCDGTRLAARGAVVVTLNYRSGLFGYFAHPALSRESPQRTSGNYGLLDQIAALQWVQRNIAAFGGDPQRVTVFGVSAGSASIALMLVMPQAAGLFQRAILHSPGTARPLASLADAEAAGAAALGTDLEALRRLKPGELFALTPRLVPAMRGLTTPRVLRPIRDGVVVTEDERDAFRAGRLHRMPIIVGTNADEGSLLTRNWPVATLADRRRIIEANFPGAVDEALRVYPARSDAEAKASIGQAFGDTQFNHGARILLRAMSRLEPRCWCYRFTRRRPGRSDGPHHGDEFGYVFGELAVGRGTEPEPFDGGDVAVSAAMSAAWLAFARDGDPNAEGAPAWPRYDAATDLQLTFGDRIALDGNPRSAALAFLDRYVAGG